MDTERKLLITNLILTIIILVVLVVGGLIYTKDLTFEERDIFEAMVSQLDKHPELENYTGFYPRITRLNQVTINTLLANNLTFYQNAKEGDYLLEYLGMTVIYDFDKDKIVNLFEQERAPDDLDDKLFAHPEAADHQDVVQLARITKLDDQFLSTAKANNATFFDNARSGDYLFEWDDLVLIYDYENDRIVNFFTREQLPQDFALKLFAHPEVQDHSGVNPTVTILDQQFLDTMRENNATFFDNAKVGDYLVEWQDLVVIYDYDNNVIINSLIPQQAPADLLIKVTAHEGLETYTAETPRVSIVTEDVLPQLLEQFPNIYANAQAGNYVIRYTDKLIIYDYENDFVVDSFDLVPRGEEQEVVSEQQEAG